MPITNEIADKAFEKLETIVKIKSGGLRLQSIDGCHITFAAKNDDEAFMKGSELYAIIKRAYALDQRPSALIIYQWKTWWNLDKCASNDYKLTIGLN